MGAGECGAGRSRIRGRLWRGAGVLLACFAACAPAAHAGLSNWTSLTGLTAGDGADWVRVYATGTPPTTIYAGTDGDGVFKSVDDGLTWSSFSNGIPLRRPRRHDLHLWRGCVRRNRRWPLLGHGQPVVRGLVDADRPGAEPTPRTRRSSTRPCSPSSRSSAARCSPAPSPGMFTSQDDGQTWSPRRRQRHARPGLTVWSFASFATFVWAATTDGIFRSSDAGATWTLSSDGIPESATTLSVFQDSQNPLIYYAETASDGLYRSIDGGITWQNVDGDDGPEPLDGGQTPTIHAIQEFSGTTQTRLYVATSDGLWVGTLPNVTIAMGKSIEVPGRSSGGRSAERGPHGCDPPIMWALSSFTNVPGTLLAGTQAFGGYSLTFQPPSNDGQPTQDLPSWLAFGIEPLQVGIGADRYVLATGTARRRSTSAISGSGARAPTPPPARASTTPPTTTTRR